LDTIDFILLLPILYGAYSGYQKGVLVEVVGVAAFVVAIILGFKLLGAGMNFISPYIGEQLSQRFMPYLSFTLIFFPTIYLLNRFGWMIRKALRFTVLGTFDSIAGALVGAFTWIFGVSTLLWLIQSINIHSLDNHLKKSLLVPYIQPVAPKIISNISDLIPVGGNLIKEWVAQ
jgi:membrane protein required for colicin V production